MQEIGLGDIWVLGLEFLANVILEHDIRRSRSFGFVGIPWFLDPSLLLAVTICLYGFGFAFGSDSRLLGSLSQYLGKIESLQRVGAKRSLCYYLGELVGNSCTVAQGFGDSIQAFNQLQNIGSGQWGKRVACWKEVRACPLLFSN